MTDGSSPLGSTDWVLPPTWTQKLIIEFNRRFGLGNGALRKYGVALIGALRAGPLDYSYFGLRLRFFPPLRRSGHMLLSPGWSERRERAFLERRMPPAGVFLDIGANVGYYTFFVAARWPEARILSVEPVREHAAVLEFNKRLNALDRLTLEQVFLSDREGTALFNRAAESIVLGAGTEDVKTATLRRVLASHGIEAIDCMKIDVEGAEDRILMPFFRATPKALWPKALLIEHACRAHWKEDCLAFALANGYREEFRSKLNAGLVLGP
jgi:FkbM family methyltransferase